MQISFEVPEVVMSVVNLFVAQPIWSLLLGIAVLNRLIFHLMCVRAEKKKYKANPENYPDRPSVFSPSVYFFYLTPLAELAMFCELVDRIKKIINERNNSSFKALVRSIQKLLENEDNLRFLLEHYTDISYTMCTKCEHIQYCLLKRSSPYREELIRAFCKLAKRHRCQETTYTSLVATMVVSALEQRHLYSEEFIRDLVVPEAVFKNCRYSWWKLVLDHPPTNRNLYANRINFA